MTFLILAIAVPIYLWIGGMVATLRKGYGRFEKPVDRIVEPEGQNAAVVFLWPFVLLSSVFLVVKEKITGR